MLEVQTRAANLGDRSLACNDDAPGSQQSQVTVPVLPGVTYYIQAGGAGRASGMLHLHADLVPTVLQAP